MQFSLNYRMSLHTEGNCHNGPSKYVLKFSSFSITHTRSKKKKEKDFKNLQQENRIVLTLVVRLFVFELKL